MYFKLFIFMRLLLSLFVLTQHDGFAGDFSINEGSMFDDLSSPPPKRRDCLVSRSCIGRNSHSSLASACTTEDGYYSEEEDLSKLPLCPAVKSPPECIEGISLIKRRPLFTSLSAVVTSGPVTSSGSSPNSARKSALKIPSFREQLRPKAAVIGGGLLGVMTALDLNSVGFDVTLFESSPDVISGASQTAAVLHGGGGEYLHTLTKVHCQETGDFFKATFPRLYGKSNRSIIFAPHPDSDLKVNAQKVAHQSAKGARRRKAKKARRDESHDVSFEQGGSNSQLDVLPEIMQKAHPKLSDGVISTNDILMETHERDAILKKALRKYNINVICNFTVERILKNEEKLFEIIGDDGVRHEGFLQTALVAWNASVKILEASFPSKQPPLIGAEHSSSADTHVSFSSEIDDEAVAIVDASCFHERVATALPPLVEEDRVLVLVDIRDVDLAARDAIMTLTGGAMIIPINEKIAIAYGCGADFSYPKEGVKEISEEDVLHHGENIVAKLKGTFGLEGIKLAGAIKKVVVRKADAPLNERVFLPPVVTPEGVIVGLGEKATYAATLALQITRLALTLSPKIHPEFWIHEIDKLIPDNSCSYTGNPLPDAFIRDKGVEVAYSNPNRAAIPIQTEQ